MKAKLLSILIQNTSDNSEVENNYYSESTDSDYESSQLPVVNVITTTKSHKEFLVDVIGQIPDGNLKKEYLEKLIEDEITPNSSLNESASAVTTRYKQITPSTHVHEKVQSLQHIIHHVKQRVQTLPASANLHPHLFALSIPGCQTNMSTNKTEICAIVFIIVKFQNNLFIKRFFLRINCKSVKELLLKHVAYLVSKRIVARLQDVLSTFDFEMKFLNYVNNSSPAFLTREFWQGTSDTNISLQEEL